MNFSTATNLTGIAGDGAAREREDLSGLRAAGAGAGVGTAAGEGQRDWLWDVLLICLAAGLFFSCAAILWLVMQGLRGDVARAEALRRAPPAPIEWVVDDED